MKKHLYLFLSLFIIFSILQSNSQIQIVEAQGEVDTEPIYIVNPGDTLWGISRTFNVDLEELATKNNIADPSQLVVGTRLIIPGYEGLQGVLVISEVPFGENLASLSRSYQIPEDDLVRLNRWTSPDQAAAGSTLITLENEGAQESAYSSRTALRKNMSVFELALISGINRWDFYQENDLNSIREVLPGEIYFFPGEEQGGPGALPEVIESITFSPRTLVQGKTTELQIITRDDLILGGGIGDYVLNFFPHNQGYVALQGVHALIEPGFFPASLSGILPDGTKFDFSQYVYIQDGGYPFDPPLVVNSETIDTENTKPEDLEWQSIVVPINEERLWEGIFTPPVAPPLDECFPSLFGSRRSYNGSAYDYFHTGLDFCGGVGVEIYAPAAGKIVFGDSLIVRGNAIVIDHGWGVYTAYAHLSEILVEVGDIVQQGQLIGLIGSTGRVTGPHLHWEVIVGGIQVDPLDWLRREYP